MRCPDAKVGKISTCSSLEILPVSVQKTHLGNLISITTDDSSHEIVVSTEVFRSGIVNDVGSQLERPCEVRTHHRVVDDDDCVLLVSFDELSDRFDVGNL